MVLKKPAALHVNMTTARGGYPSSLMGTIAYIRQSFLDADYYANAWQPLYAKNPKGMKRPEFDPFLEALVPYVRDKKPVVFQCNNCEDIKRVLKIVDEFKLNALLSHANEAWRDAAVLKKAADPAARDARFPPAEPEPLRDPGRGAAAKGRGRDLSGQRGRPGQGRRRVRPDDARPGRRGRGPQGRPGRRSRPACPGTRPSRPSP